MATTTTHAVSTDEADDPAVPRPIEIVRRGSPHRSEWLSRLVELTILCLTLVITALFNLFIFQEMHRQTALNRAMYNQTREHFAIQRTSSAIERFNSDQLLRARRVVDHWVATAEPPGDLLDRAAHPHPGKAASELTPEQRLAVERAEHADEVATNLRLFANFFQELGTAMKHDTLHERYAWDVFGALVVRYEADLRPYVEEIRRRRGRPQLYEDFSALADRMRALDRKYAAPR